MKYQILKSSCRDVDPYYIRAVYPPRRWWDLGPPRFEDQPFLAEWFYSSDDAEERLLRYLSRPAVVKEIDIT